MTKKIETVAIEHKVLAVIDNFQCDLDEVVLNKNLSICRIDTLEDEERLAFDGERYGSNSFTHNLIENERRQFTTHHVVYRAAGEGERFDRTLEYGNYVLRWYIKERVQQPLKQHYDFLLGPQREFQTVLAGLRTMKREVIGLFPAEHFLIEMPLPKEIRRSSNRRFDGYQFSEAGNIPPYILQANDIELLQTLYDIIRVCNEAGIVTALSRIGSQYSRTALHDRLIDAVIALEALYAGENGNEITLRVALRMSAHLGGSDPDQRERYFHLMNMAYHLRSKLVHGVYHNGAQLEKEVKKKDWNNLDNFLWELDEALRLALKRTLLYVKTGKLKTLLHEPLDRCIRRGEVFIENFSS